MPNQLTGPIPGQSLTREPGNAPWEQPPLHNKPGDVIQMYLSKFKDEDTVDDLLFLLEQDFPVQTFVESLTTTGVMEGLHTVDVSMLVAPAIHEYITQLADNAGVKYTEFSGPSKDEKDKERQKKRLAIMLTKTEKESGGESKLVDDIKQSVDKMPEPAPADAQKGFIKRKTDE